MKRIHADKIHNIPKIIIGGSVFENQYGDCIQHIIGTSYFEIVTNRFTNNSDVIWKEFPIFLIRSTPPIKQLINWVKKNI